MTITGNTPCVLSKQHFLCWIHETFCYIQYCCICIIFLHQAYWTRTVTFAIEYRRHSVWNITITGNTLSVLIIRHLLSWIHETFMWHVDNVYWLLDNVFVENTLATRHIRYTRCEHVIFHTHVVNMCVEYSLSAYTPETMCVLNMWNNHDTFW